MYNIRWMDLWHLNLQSNGSGCQTDMNDSQQIPVSSRFFPEAHSYVFDIRQYIRAFHRLIIDYCSEYL